MPKPRWSVCRGTPPTCSSRSTTSTRPAPPWRSATAAASPAGPPPTTSTSTSTSLVAGGAPRGRLNEEPPCSSVVALARRGCWRGARGGPRRGSGAEQPADGTAAHLGEHGRHRGGAVEALAAAEQGAGAAAQPVQVARGDGAGERVEQLAAGDALAVADDAAVVGVGGDRLGRAVGPRERLAEVRQADPLDPLDRDQWQAGTAQLADEVLGDGEGGGQAGGADAAGAGVALRGVHLELVVAVLGGGAQARVDGGDLLGEQRREDALAVGEQAGQAAGAGGGVALVVEVLGGRAEQHVAEYGRRDQHALAGRGRHRKKHVAQERAGQLVEHDQLATPRGDGETV